MNLQEMLYGLIGTFVIGLIRQYWKDRTDQRLLLVKEAAEMAYNIVNEISARTETKIDDKVSEGLKIFVDILKNSGIKPSAPELDRATLIFKAMHGKEIKK